MKMRQILKISIAVLFLSGLTVVAQEVVTLKENMKQIGSLHLAISLSKNDPAKNQINAEKAKQMGEFFTLVINQIPDVIKEMAAADQDNAIHQFQTLIQQEIDLSAQLENAFLHDDNEAVLVLLDKMRIIKIKGHGNFSN